MKKLFGFLFLSLIINSDAQSQIWIAKNVYIRFFSKTPLEDIEGISKTASAAINTKTGKFYTKVYMNSFKFEKALMEEHFNENYMESEKYSTGEFDGQVIDLPDLSKDGVYSVKIKGVLSMHGVAKQREIEGALEVSKNKIIGKSNFKVKCIDHHIDIPKIVIKNIAEELDVTIQAEFTAKK